MRLFGHTSAPFDVVKTGLTTDSTLRSYAAWFLATGSGESGLGRLFSKGNDDVYWGATTFDYTRQWSGGFADWQVTSGVVSDGKLHHLAISYDSGSTSNVPKIYVDGVSQSVSTLIAASGTIVNNSNPFYVGIRSDNLRYFAGSIGEFAVWDAILTPTEIAAIVAGASPLDIRQAKLAGYWPIDGGDGNGIERDFSKYERHALVTHANISRVVDRSPIASPRRFPLGTRL